MSHLNVERLSSGTIYKLVALGSIFSLVPVSLLLGILSLFGLDTISWNDAPASGAKGFLVSPFIGLFLAGFATAFGGSAIAFGLWLYSFFGALQLRYEAVEEVPAYLPEMKT